MPSSTIFPAVNSALAPLRVEEYRFVSPHNKITVPDLGMASAGLLHALFLDTSVTAGE